MLNTEFLAKQFNGHIRFEPVSSGLYQIKAPFYHEDGDMMDIFLRDTGDELQICDFGASLMRLSYTFNIDTDHKEKIFNQIITNNGVCNENGNITLQSSYDTFFNDLMQYQMAISKVTNLDILKKEQISSLFFEYLSQFVTMQLSKYYSKIETSYHPTNEAYHIADYAILDNPDRPLYILAVKDSLQAARATSFCLRLSSLKTFHTSVAVYEDMDALISRDRNALTNAVDKQYSSLSDFEANGQEFINRMIA
ncbi:DUF1828 domain-containing protein [Candidatus Agathobaculum pullicola]|uniref:DUF1828 domain-containing protein n=1 Tax=Candidatus Agathobaculum pullicola TaxID=2838426 RepID=UPI003F93540D